MNRNERTKVYLSLLLILMMAAVLYGAYSAIVNPQPSHNLDGWGTEPFKADAVMRSATALTASYVDTNEVYAAPYSNMILCFDIVQGGLTSFEYRIWVSRNLVDWYVEATESVGAGVVTDEDAYCTKALTGDVAYYKVMTFRATYLKLQVKGTGVMAGNTCAVEFMGVQ